MSILSSIKNTLKSLFHPADSGDRSLKSAVPSKGGSIAATKYLKGSDDDPLHAAAQKNNNVADQLGFPGWVRKPVNLFRLAPAKQAENLSLVKPAAIAINQRTKEILKEPRVRAMLDTIAYAEGTWQDPDNGYGRVVKGKVVQAPHHPELVGQRNVTTADFSRHPNISVQFRDGEYSTAAGRYQFRHKTWSDLHLPDFSPESQDIGAVMLLKGRGSLKPLLNDDFEKAILKSNEEWASFPESPYGQPTKTMDQLKAFYNEALSSYLQEQEEQ